MLYYIIASRSATMHHFVTYAVLFLSTLYSLVTAKALLAVFHSTVVPGEVYEVEWLSDASDVSPQPT